MHIQLWYVGGRLRYSPSRSRFPRGPTMSYLNRQRCRNRTLRVEVLESRALLSTAGVVSRPAALVAPQAPLAHASRIAQDPEYTSKMMMGIGGLDTDTMQVRFFTRG